MVDRVETFRWTLHVCSRDVALEVDVADERVVVRFADDDVAEGHPVGTITQLVFRCGAGWTPQLVAELLTRCASMVDTTR